jgi:hypothetical protein
MTLHDLIASTGAQARDYQDSVGTIRRQRSSCHRDETNPRLVLLMWTNSTICPPAIIAVVAQNLVSVWEVVLDQPTD